ncbi:hypothetical protein B0T17DRAFT_480833 [Bombardia bombarda]|uniref:Uncharacterized protein n=1 Tax=Bombardia bombarda TaxID=252184 RepID=A0AA40CH87_9PEZI|nr:hypothetical protein B0T17DRAFT_480833 [Bombardia bombarda]
MDQSTAAKVHQYLGINLPLRHVEQQVKYHIGVPNDYDTYCNIMPVRELFMMVTMDRLCDKLDWHEKVFDDRIVARWRKEALAQPQDPLYDQILSTHLGTGWGASERDRLPLPVRSRFISEEVFDYCIAELRCKATFFKETGLVYTLDTDGTTVVKSDTLVPPHVQDSLKAAFDKLQADQSTEPDWHPGTNEMVQNLVHPSMYPFVYPGRSNFIQEEVVGIADAIDKWAGKGEPQEPNSPVVDPMSTDFPQEYWSEEYQWLPANLEIQENGTVKLASYINNLHPKKYPGIYSTIEKLIGIAIPAWDHALGGQVIVSETNDDCGSRFDLPESTYDEDPFWEPFNAGVLKRYEKQHGKLDLDALEDQIEDEYENLCDELDWDEENEPAHELGVKNQAILNIKWKHIRDPILTEPKEFKPLVYKSKENLLENFADSGLQVIVKMASIELTPEKPDFPVGGWHIEGQMNEHIVATALYYLDSENVTPSHLQFRMQTSEEQDDLMDRAGQDQFHIYERLYGTSLKDSSGLALQYYGDVETREGRLLAFPNSRQHRVSPFSLKDPTKPGHRRFIALWLVDPMLRIVSTANVPPQQMDWWGEAVFGDKESFAAAKTKGEMPPEVMQIMVEQGVTGRLGLALDKLDDLVASSTERLPAEIMDMVRSLKPTEGLMSVEEAREHREKLMEERSRADQLSQEKWTETSLWNFCEH